MESHLDSLLWRQVVEEMPLRVYVKSVADDLRYVLYNKKLCEDIGKDPAQVEGRRVWDVFPPDVADGFEAMTRATLEMDEPNTAGQFDFTVDGIRRELRTMEKVYTAPDGRRYVFGYCQDVTEANDLLRAERTIDEVSSVPIEGGDFLQGLFDIVAREDRLNVVELRWMTRDGTESRVIRSPRAVEPTAMALDAEALKQAWDIHRARIDAEGLAVYLDLPAETPGIPRAKFPSKVCSACLAVLPVSVHETAPLGDMAFVFRSRREFSPRYRELLKLLGRTLSIAYMRIHAHRELQRQLARAEEAERAKSYFFASVSHDIRTPLNSIIGFSELLKADRLDEATRKQYLETIVSSGQVLLKLVNDVLDLAKLKAGRMSFDPVMSDFPRVVQDVARALLPQAQEKGLRIRTRVDSEFPLVEIDPQRIRQVLFNLVGNAVKFTDEGQVQVSAEFCPDAAGRSSGTLRFGVGDTGRGISEEDQKRLMQPFVQLLRTDQGRGTGLGLAICRQLVEGMGGVLSIESRVGAGSLFSVELPNVRFARGAPAGRDLPRPEMPRRFSHFRFLLVDDVALNLQVLRSLFARLGVTDLVTARSGEEALAVLEKEGASFDAVLTDLWMPKMGGGELVARLRGDARFASLPIYAVTADGEVAKTYRELGFTGLLLKPVTLEALTAFLEDVCRIAGR